MTEEEALKVALEWFKDVTDGRPQPKELEAAQVLRDMYLNMKNERMEIKRTADRIDGYDRDDLGESPDY